MDNIDSVFKDTSLEGHVFFSSEKNEKMYEHPEENAEVGDIFVDGDGEISQITSLDGDDGKIGIQTTEIAPNGEIEASVERVSPDEFFRDNDNGYMMSSNTELHVEELAAIRATTDEELVNSITEKQLDTDDRNELLNDVAKAFASKEDMSAAYTDRREQEKEKPKEKGFLKMSDMRKKSKAPKEENKEAQKTKKKDLSEER